MTQKLANIASSAIESVEINSDNNTVIVTYKSSPKEYSYAVEDVDTFEQQLLQEIPYSESPEEDDKSVGRFINQSVNDGTLKLLVD